MSKTSEYYAETIRKRLKDMEPDEPLLEDAFNVEWCIEVKTTEYAGTNGEDAWEPDTGVSYTAEGYVSVYGSDAYTLANGAFAIVSPSEVAADIADVYRDTVDEAIRVETDYWWGVLTDTESDYPADYMSLADLDCAWLGETIGKTYFRRHAGETLREKVAAYWYAEKLVPESFGLADAFRELYLIEPDMRTVDAAELIAAELGAGDDFNTVLDIAFDVERGRNANHYRERYSK